MGVSYQEENSCVSSPQILKAQVKLDFGEKNEYLRTDNEGEYNDKEFDKFYEQEGIKRQFITAYIPQQVGVTE